jgi:uncharacterized Zn finger protein
MLLPRANTAQRNSLILLFWQRNFAIMELEARLSSFFGSQERSKGAELLRKDLVVISSASETDVRAFVKGSSSCRVSLSAEEVDTTAFTSTCTCPQARKGELCKHVWAVLLKLQENDADFLNEKIEVVSAGVKSNPGEDARLAKQQKFKSQQKLKLKERNKEIRQRKKLERRGARIEFPEPVRESLDYFKANGFPLDGLNLPALIVARKRLSLVFHPDKGGNHEEVLELNSHFEVLQSYLES